MKKYSTLLLSSTFLLATLANSPLVAAQDATTESNSVVTNSAIQLNQSVTSQQNGSTLSIFYQRSDAQKDLKIEHAIWSNENGQDDLRWYVAQDAQTDISLLGFKSGQYTIHTYITIDNKQEFLQETTTHITQVKPNLTAKISEQGIIDVLIQNISPDVREVLLPTWSTVNGQDDLKWYQAQKQADGSYALRIFLRNHKFNVGEYLLHLYTKDAQGRTNFVTHSNIQVSNNDIPSNPKPVLAIENLQASKGKYQVTIEETATSKPIQSVQIATWSMEKQANLKWRTARLQDGKYRADIDFQEHQNHSGKYTNHVYVTYSDGSKVGYPLDLVDLTSARLPLQFSSKFISLGQFQMTLANVYDTGTVSYAVWSDENGQDDLKWYTATQSATRTFSGNISLANHKGIGKYHVHVYQNGKGLGAFSMDVANEHRYNTNNTYPVGQCTWGAKQLAPWIGNYWGNAGLWLNSARNAGFTTGKTPRVGAVAVWTNSYYGHVAVVTAVHANGTIEVKECNMDGKGKQPIANYRGAFVPSSIAGYIYP